MNSAPVTALIARFLPDKAQVVPRLRWFAANVQRALGSRGTIALLVIAAALATQLGVINPGNEGITMRLAEAQAGISVKPDAVQNKAPSMMNQLATTDTFDVRLETLIATLKSHRLLIQDLQFQYSPVDENKLQRLEVELPMFGTYLMLREVLPTLLEQPAVRVESVSLTRKKIGDPVTEIRLKISLLGVKK